MQALEGERLTGAGLTARGSVLPGRVEPLSLRLLTTGTSRGPVTMANAKLGREAGQGGKLGHSNMGHYGKTEEVKAAAKKRRRAEAKRAIDAGLRTPDEEDHA